MYLRSTPRRNKDGSEVRYLQLAHNVWDPAAKRSRVQVGPQLRPGGARHAGGAGAAGRVGRPAPGARGGRGLRRRSWSSRSPGRWAAPGVLDALWERLGIGPAMRDLLTGSEAWIPLAERVLFALAANRALAPSSKLAADGLGSARTCTIEGPVPRRATTSCYRAMDLAPRRPGGTWSSEVFHQVARPAGLEADLLFLRLSG